MHNRTRRVLAIAAFIFAIGGCSTVQPVDPSEPTLSPTRPPEATMPTAPPTASNAPTPMATDSSMSGKGGDTDNRYVAHFGDCPLGERLLPDDLAERGVIDETEIGIGTNPIVEAFLVASGAPVACNAMGASADGTGHDAAELVVMPVETEDPAGLAAQLAEAAATATDPTSGERLFGTASEVVTLEAGGRHAVGIVGSHPDIIVGPHAVVMVLAPPTAVVGDEAALRAFFVQLGNLEPRS